MDYSYHKSLRKLLYALYKLELNDTAHCASHATGMIRRVEKVIAWEENDKARQRILEKYGHIKQHER